MLRSILATTSLAFLFLACSSIRTLPPGADNPDLHVGSLRQMNPLEVAVLPVQNNTGKADLPLDVLRGDLYQVLLQRYYTPLALTFVDQQVGVAEASYVPGTLQEDAVMQMFLTKWDDTNWQSRAELVIEGDIYLLDVSDPDPTRALWGGRFSRRVSVANERASASNAADLMNRAVDRFVDQILASLPVRDPSKPPSN